MTTQLADGVFQLTPMPYLNTVAVRGAEGWTLVDTGAPQRDQRLVDLLVRIGVRRGDVERVVLTHGHFDHAGGVDRIREAFGAREVLVGGADVGAVREGSNPPGGVPGRLPTGYPRVPDAAPVDDPAVDEIVLGDDRRLVPVPTPGHTPGHVSYHLPEEGIVIGGDVLFNVFRLRPAPGFLCADATVNRRSVMTIASLAPSTLQLAHGDPVTGDVTGRLREVADR